MLLRAAVSELTQFTVPLMSQQFFFTALLDLLFLSLC